MASGTSPEQLIQSLDQAVARLRSLKQPHWADWLQRGRDLVAAGDFRGVTHTLSAFGGAGSINDLALSRNGGAVYEKDATLDELLNAVHTVAYELQREEKRR